jgi:pimeloyl-ACP methyl ester carboxylesterase
MQRQTFVLIPGAWCGAWAWKEITALLRANGHVASPITLSGLGDRSLSSMTRIDLTTHITDTTRHIAMEDLDGITLVGWSYGGVVATGVAEAIPDKIRSLVYLDGFVPENGKAVVDYLTPAARAANQARADSDQALLPMPLERFGVVDKVVIDFVTPRLTSQPWRTFFDPIRVTSVSEKIPKSYIRCTKAKLQHFDNTLSRVREREDFKCTEIDADHFSVLSAPQLTAEHLMTL